MRVCQSHSDFSNKNPKAQIKNKEKSYDQQCLQPLRGGAIDSDSAEGNEFISQMTTDLDEDDKFYLKQENAVDFKENLEETGSEFCYDSIAHSIPSSHGTEGSAPETNDLLNKPNECSLGAVVDFVQQVWGNYDADFLIYSNHTLETEPITL